MISEGCLGTVAILTDSLSMEREGGGLALCVAQVERLVLGCPGLLSPLSMLLTLASSRFLMITVSASLYLCSTFGRNGT